MDCQHHAVYFSRSRRCHGQGHLLNHEAAGQRIRQAVVVDRVRGFEVGCDRIRARCGGSCCGAVILHVAHRPCHGAVNKRRLRSTCVGRGRVGHCECRSGLLDHEAPSRSIGQTVVADRIRGFEVGCDRIDARCGRRGCGAVILHVAHRPRHGAVDKRRLRSTRVGRGRVGHRECRRDHLDHEVASRCIGQAVVTGRVRRLEVGGYRIRTHC